MRDPQKPHVKSPVTNMIHRAGLEPCPLDQCSQHKGREDVEQRGEWVEGLSLCSHFEWEEKKASLLPLPSACTELAWCFHSQDKWGLKVTRINNCGSI